MVFKIIKRPPKKDYIDDIKRLRVQFALIKAMVDGDPTLKAMVQNYLMPLRTGKKCFL